MDKVTQAQEWQRFTAMDLDSAYLLKMHPVPIEIICYHCQQHDLDELYKLCTGLSNTFKNIADHCSDLTAYGVHSRYPMTNLNHRTVIHYSLVKINRTQRKKNTVVFLCRKGYTKTKAISFCSYAYVIIKYITTIPGA